MLEILVFGADLGEEVQLQLQQLVGRGDGGVDAVQVLGVFGGGQAGRGGHQGATVLGNLEGGGHLRNAQVVDLVLGIADPVEGKPANQAGGDGQHNGAADAQVKLGRQAEPAVQRTLQKPAGCLANVEFL